MISFDEVFYIHQTLEDCGEVKRRGINNKILLESAINGQYWYSNPFDALCHVAFSVNAYHCFYDGNKRTSYFIIKSSGFIFNESLLSDIILVVADGRIKDKNIFIQQVHNCILG